MLLLPLDLTSGFNKVDHNLLSGCITDRGVCESLTVAYLIYLRSGTEGSASTEGIIYSRG